MQFIIEISIQSLDKQFKILSFLSKKLKKIVAMFVKIIGELIVAIRSWLFLLANYSKTIAGFLIFTNFMMGKNCQQQGIPNFEEIMKWHENHSFDSFGKMTTVAPKVHPELYNSSDDVIELTSLNFDELVCHNEQLWIVQFYSKDCKLDTKSFCFNYEYRRW